jgi:hypothetical protein
MRRVSRTECQGADAAVFGTALLLGFLFDVASVGRGSAEGYRFAILALRRVGGRFSSF